MDTYGDFQQIVWDYYRAHGRHDLPWRIVDRDGVIDPYKIMVSEIMLQQTQVSRVIPKFQQFLEAFPDAKSLSAATLGEVLLHWSSLGYNRRAKFLWQAANLIVHDHGGKVPASREQLMALPGIGSNTAGAILVYAFSRPEVFIETNIRTVFIYHFFTDAQQVSDGAIVDLVEATLPDQNVREWCWALMDYGTYLKQTVGNVSRQSKGFVRQSQFQGSRRQIRGQVLKLLAVKERTPAQIRTEIADERLPSVLDDLTQEGLIISTEHAYMLP